MSNLSYSYDNRDMIVEEPFAVCHAATVLGEDGVLDGCLCSKELYQTVSEFLDFSESGMNIVVVEELSFRYFVVHH